MSSHLIFPVVKQDQTGTNPRSSEMSIPTVPIDVWEIDARLLKYEYKVASGPYGDTYKGTFCSQDVAIKHFRAEHLCKKLQKEFAQEVFIMRFVNCKILFPENSPQYHLVVLITLLFLFSSSLL
ncbi:unnamed protein product [Linum tenue]|uniref:Uncharacterized protein n=1 Tax=Linum tenue TaxID=586396 RepID=A0AAV0HCT4_9ROSI|nr:unnamed protein product [Linum tenue]